MDDLSMPEPARGSAAGVTSMLLELGCGDEEDAESVFGELFNAFIRPGMWFSATAPALREIFALLPTAANQDMLLIFASELTGADHLDAWRRSPRPSCDNEKQVLDVACQHGELLLDFLRSENPALRAAATLPLAMLAPLSSRSWPHLSRLAAGDTDEVVRASSLLAMSLLSRSAANPELAALPENSEASPLVRGVLGLIRLASSRCVNDPEIEKSLSLWLEHEFSRTAEPGITQFPWFGGAWLQHYWQGPDSSPASTALGLLADLMDDPVDLVDLLVRIHPRLSGTGRKRAGAAIAEIGLLPGQTQAIPFDRLSPLQRTIGERLSDTCLFPLGGRGVPAAGLPRLRWAGRIQKGPLEMTVAQSGCTEQQPLWEAWLEQWQDPAGKEAVPAQLENGISGPDRWRAVVDMCAGAFSGLPRTSFNALEDDEAIIEKEVSLLLMSKDWMPAVSETLDDLSRRMGAERAQSGRSAIQLPASALCLLPLVRTGHPISTDWDELVVTGGQRLAMEILGALEPDRREAIVYDRLQQSMPFPNVRAVMSVFEIWPSRRVGDALLSSLRSPSPQLPPNAVEKAVSEIETILEGMTDTETPPAGQSVPASGACP